ncbi:MAG: ferrous iron transport protein A [Desulfobacteraceae bacterium]|uniref:Ferrous iron transport protein A n=1 Tax=Candidatus Desulfaltia bathyphila TaxID=2841697 RepID=A0A8J6N7K6_9BACT|nr:ferrous iron transport protein A [Candidatus Desulfaltia bathyphila]MBL7196440.1 ferrous iron transport protein A [Desulfobacterales bacterium]
MTLDEIKPDQECEIVDITSEGIMGQRLLDMGFIPGTRIKVIRNAPLVDPVEFELKGYNISLRHSEAKQVEVTLL